MKKKGVSDIITIMLLILLVIIIFTIIYILTLNYIRCQKQEIKVKERLIRESMYIEEVEFWPNPEFPTAMNITLRRGRAKLVENTSAGDDPPPLDMVVISDASGSMKWCDDISETDEKPSLFLYFDELYCGNRRFLSVPESICDVYKLKTLVEIEKDFIKNIIENSVNSRIGIVEYSSSTKYLRIDKPDIDVKLGVFPVTNCYEEDWYKLSYDDSSWGEYTARTNSYSPSATRCERCKVMFRKKFDLSNKDELVDFYLKVANKDGIVCYLNENEIYHSQGYTLSRYWNNTMIIPAYYFQEGENLLSCMISVRYGTYGFDIELDSNRENIITRREPWKYQRMYNCEDSSEYGYNPKSYRVIEGVNNNFKLVASVTNHGQSILGNIDLRVNLIDNSLSEDLVIDGLLAGETKTYELDWTKFTESDLTFIANVDPDKLIDEIDEVNNIDEVIIPSYLLDKDLRIRRMPTLSLCGGGEPNPLRFYADITNDGTLDISESFDFSFYLGEYPTGTRIGSPITINSLNAQSTRRIYHNWHDHGLTESTTYYGIVDENNAISESNEDNNRYAQEIKVSAPDFYAHRNYMRLREPVCSEGLVDVKAQLRTLNKGGCPSPQSDIAMSMDNIDYSNSNILPPLGSRRYSSYIDFDDQTTIAPGQKTYRIHYKVDPNDNVFELGGTPDGNYINYAYRDFYVGPNLEFNSNNGFVITPNVVAPGSTHEFTLTVNYHNDQCDSSLEEFEITFYREFVDEANEVGSVSVSSGSGTAEITITDTIEEDTTYYAYLDSGEVIDEYREGSNNLRSFRVIAEPSEAECIVDSDCLEDHYGDKFCKLGNVYRKYHDYECNEDSECEEVITDELYEECEDGCNRGRCDANEVGSVSVISGSGTAEITITDTIKDTTDYAYLDSGEVIDEYRESSNNLRSFRVIADPSLIGQSILPLELFDFKQMLSVVDRCSAEDYTTDTELFTGGIVRFIDLTDDVSYLSNFLDESEAWRGTCICCGILKSAEMIINEEHDEEPVRVIILMSDGAPNRNQDCGIASNGAEASIEAARRAFEDHGIIVYTIGFGGDINLELMNNIANVGGGEFYYAENAEELAEAFHNIAGHILRMIEAVKTFDHLKIIIHSEDDNIEVEEIEFDELPLPFETKVIQVTEISGIRNPKKIEINAATDSPCRKNIVSHILDTFKIRYE